MDIEKQITKLNQLDRIEFRQKHRIIEEDAENGFLKIGFSLLFLLFILSTGFLISQSLGGDLSNLKEILELVGRMTFVIMMISFIEMIYNGYTLGKKRKELFSEYFNIEVKKEGKK